VVFIFPSENRANSKFNEKMSQMEATSDTTITATGAETPETLRKRVLPESENPGFMKEFRTEFEELRRVLGAQIIPDGQTSTEEIEAFIAEQNLTAAQEETLRESFTINQLESGVGDLPVNNGLTIRTQGIVDEITAGTSMEGVEVLVVEASYHGAYIVDEDTFIITTRMMESLPEEDLEALIRHEIAHLVHEDPVHFSLANMYIRTDMESKPSKEQDEALAEFSRQIELKADAHVDTEVPGIMSSLLHTSKERGIGIIPKEAYKSSSHPTHEQRIDSLSSALPEQTGPGSAEYQELQSAVIESEAQRLQSPAVHEAFGVKGTINWDQRLSDSQREQVATLSETGAKVKLTLNTGEVYRTTNSIDTDKNSWYSNPDFFAEMRYGISIDAEVEAIEVIEPIGGLQINERTGKAFFRNSAEEFVTIPQHYERELESGTITSEVRQNPDGTAFRRIIFKPNEPDSDSERIVIGGLSAAED
jgi:predicted RNA binding protein YcfA (HicA-like mRNA interferase family)